MGKLSSSSIHVSIYTHVTYYYVYVYTFKTRIYAAEPPGQVWILELGINNSAGVIPSDPCPAHGTDWMAETRRRVTEKRAEGFSRASAHILSIIPRNNTPSDPMYSAQYGEKRLRVDTYYAVPGPTQPSSDVFPGVNRGYRIPSFFNGLWQKKKTINFKIKK